MEVEATAIPAVKLIRPRVFRDSRGCFSETYRSDSYAQAGIDTAFVQDNLSLSPTPGTVRGLHFQLPPHAQAKLVSVASGRVLDVALDLRRGSPTFAQHVAVELSAADGEQLFVPEGFAHGFCSLAPDTRVTYKVSAFYAPDHEAGLRWDDPTLGIVWPVAAADALLSDKDLALPALAAFETPFVYAGEPVR
ncbi:MAG: dTDP-4-dehydrorhamnose 3,5-epimerase [Alphaproteobacteria bacterium]|jgi:dTDP-4-dehydrorhamnose 3,5-epimerase|nr:dTDP-4-dehydrorhamnose 3,5-epimerase [Alphaproteobacteria bacterium]